MNQKSSPKARLDWREDLASSRDLNERQISGFGYFLGWFENWRLRARLPADLGVARRFWKEVVLEKKFELIGKLEGVYGTAARLQYGSGLRLKELVSLRIGQVDLERGTVTVKGGKGDRDRTTVLPASLREELEEQMRRCRGLWEADRQARRPGVALPNALGRKWPKAGERWEWFWLFPARGESKDPESGIVRRHHLHPKVYGRALRRAVEAAELERGITSHSLSHAYAFTTHLLEAGCDLRTRLRWRYAVASDPGFAGARRREDDRDLHARGKECRGDGRPESAGRVRRVGGRCREVEGMAAGVDS